VEVRIATLSENTANFGFLAEWGLSILVETNNLKILVDTGLSMSAVHNAQVLGIDLSTIDKIVLSHGHIDHTGGLREVLKRTGKVEVIAHPDIWAAKYARLKEQEFYAGIPFQREELESLGASFNLTREPVSLGDGIMTTGEVPMSTSYEEIDPNIFVKREGKLYPDPLADDLSLVIDTEQGLIVIPGCAHRGIINTLLHAQKLTGKKLIHAVIGGVHLFRASENQVEQTVTALKEMGIKKLGVSHCTGFYASAHLARQFGDSFFLNNVGTCLTLP